MFKKDRWNLKLNILGGKVKKIWLRYWDYSKPNFLDKSIPNIMRVDEIQKVFRPIKYICVVQSLCSGYAYEKKSTGHRRYFIRINLEIIPYSLLMTRCKE